MKNKYKILIDYKNEYVNVKAGDTIYEFYGHDYGCVRDDMAYRGIESKAMIADPDADSPFFTVDVKYLEEIV